MINKFNLRDEVKYSLHPGEEKEYKGIVQVIGIINIKQKLSNTVYYRVKGPHGNMNLTEVSLERVE